MSNEEALRGAYPGRLEREPASSINRVPWKYYKAVYETYTAFRLSTGAREGVRLLGRLFVHERRYDEMSHLEQSTLYLSGLDELMSEVGAKVADPTGKNLYGLKACSDEAFGAMPAHLPPPHGPAEPYPMEWPYDVHAYDSLDLVDRVRIFKHWQHVLVRFLRERYWAPFVPLEESASPAFHALARSAHARRPVVLHSRW